MKMPSTPVPDVLAGGAQRAPPRPAHDLPPPDGRQGAGDLRRSARREEGRESRGVGRVICVRGRSWRSAPAPRRTRHGSAATAAIVHRADPAQPWAEALAIRGDRIIAVGDTADHRWRWPAPARAALDLRAPCRRSRPQRRPPVNDERRDGRRAGAVLGAEPPWPHGVTSLQWFSVTPVAAPWRRHCSRPTRRCGCACSACHRPGAGGGPATAGPIFPPQPTLGSTCAAWGSSWARATASGLRQAVGWAYGTEDLLAIGQPDDRPRTAAYLVAVATHGAAEVWKTKRPRVERPAGDAGRLAPRLAAHGMVVVQRPGRALRSRSLVSSRHSAGAGFRRGTRPFEVLAWRPRPSAARRR